VQKAFKRKNLFKRLKFCRIKSTKAFPKRCIHLNLRFADEIISTKIEISSKKGTVSITFETVLLTGKLLIAMPSMGDPRFTRSVVYLCSHNADGALGLIINKKIDALSFPKILSQLNIENLDQENNDAREIYFGGPVETERGFILHSLEYQSEFTLLIDEKIGMTASVEIIKALARGNGPKQSLVALGYAGWGPGQLDKELQENAWLNVDADMDLTFSENYDEKWDKALNKVGVSAALLSTESGRA